MKTILSSLVLLLSVGTSFAAVFKEAEVTRTINDVRVMPDQQAAFPAKPGQKINGKTAVATGVQSRAELRFPDKTITRLGANTTFRLEEGTRNIDLDRGVILLQVPKQMGGATVRTAAVTAAVTGTTLLVEYEPNGYIKIIVLEGSVDIFLKDDHSTFRTINAGDMLIMKPDAKLIPMPVQVDLERLQKTSKLMDPKEFAPLGNEKHMQGALQGQDKKMNKGELHKTAFVIPGRGTRVNLPNEIRRELARFGIRNRDGGTRGPGGTKDGPGGPGGSGTPRAPRIPGTAVVTTNTNLQTNPHISTIVDPFGPVTRAPGAFYRPKAGDGAFNEFFFGKGATYTEIDTLAQNKGVWAGFLFDDIYILGTPNIDSTVGSRHLILAAVNSVTLTNAISESYFDIGLWDLDAAGAPIDSLVIAAGKGGISVEPGFSILGSTQTVAFYAPAAQADVLVTGSFYDPTTIDVQQGRFLAHAGRDVIINGAKILTKATDLHSDRDVIIQNGAIVGSSSRLDIASQRSISITNSSELRRLASTDLSNLHLDARGGDLTISDSSIDAANVFLESQNGDLVMSNATITGDVVRAQTLSPNGTLLLGGNSSLTATNALKLYAQGSNGHVRFSGPVTLDSPVTVVAGKTVTVDVGISVDVRSPGGFRVYTDNAQFSNNTPNGYGDFRSGGAPFAVSQQPFGSRPGF